MGKDVYLQPHVPDPALSDDVVFSLVRQHVPGVKAVTGVDESGGEARTYAIDENIILKTQRPHRLRPRTSLEKEVIFLKQLSFDDRISVPRVLGYGREGDIEYTVMTRMPGVAVVNTTLTGDARRETMFEVGQTLRRIHQIEQTSFHQSGLFPTDETFSDVKERIESSFTRLVEKMHNDNSDWTLSLTPEQVAKRAIDTLPETTERVGLHSNPGPTHTFVHADTGRFSGLIDFGDAYISHPALDLYRWNLPEDREAVLAGYTSEHQVSESFLGILRSVMVLSNLMSIAYRTKTMTESRKDLKKLVHEI